MDWNQQAAMPAPAYDPSAQAAGLAGAVKSGMQRGTDNAEPDAARAALVKRWIAAVKDAKAHWKPAFKQMKMNMDFASGKQWPGQGDDDDRYMVNIVQRVVKASLSSMYAKNPTVVAKRRETLDFRIWDGKLETIQAATQAMQMAAETGQPPDPSVTALLQDIQQGTEYREMMDRVGKTMETLARYYMEEQEPDFKSQMKQMVRRARTTCVGYAEIGFQRQMELSDDQTTRISDMTERLATIGRMHADIMDGEVDPDSATAEELKLAIAAIQAEPSVIVREGLVFTFPQSTRIIPSPETQKLIGWIGCPWIAKEILLTPERVKEVYGIDVAKSYTSYKADAGAPTSSARNQGGGSKSKSVCCVWHVFDKDTGLEYVLCDGYPDFLKEPAAPDVAVEQFFPIFAITFNDVEDEGRLFPQSDVELIMHAQREYNRCKEAKRQHRIANRPLYLAAEGAFDEKEEDSLAGHAAHDVIKVKALRDGVKVDELLVPMKKIGVDPNLYETQEIMGDIMLATGYSEASLGTTAGSPTATQSSIAAAGMQGATGLDADELDEMLTRLWRAAGQIMLMELSEETVQGIAGVGAVWPSLSRLDIMKEVGLEVKAGSSGRPNQAQQAATLERLYPLLLQVPGISPRWLAEIAIGIADDDVNLEDAILDGLPSIIAQNAAAQLPNNANSNPAGQAQSGAQGRAGSPGPGAPGGTAKPAYTPAQAPGAPPH